MKQWFTAQELADLSLTDMPRTKMGCLKKAQRESWNSREHDGRGGGREFHIDNLPLSTQAEIVKKLLGSEAIAILDDQSALQEMKAGRRRGRLSPEERRHAKTIVVGLFERFRTNLNLGVIEAEKGFISYYAAEASTGQSARIPAWVVETYPAFSIQTLRRWRKDAETDIAALGGRYGNRKGTGVLDRAEDGDVKDFIVGLLTGSTHLKAGHMRDMCRAKYGDTVKVRNLQTNEPESVPLPKIRVFERFIANWKEENMHLFEKLTNPDSHKNKRQISVGFAGDGIDRLNQVWQIDASPVDALCVDGRYALYAIIDVWSRRALFSVTKTPRTEAALILIRRAIMEWGVPEVIKTDNGSDFVSKRFTSALAHLGIQQDICPPYSPEKKPFVERVIQTLQHDLMPVLPGFIGHNVADRQQIRARQTFAQRLGVDDQKTFSISLSHQDVQGMIDRWARDKYGQSSHRGLGGLSPAAKAATWTGISRKIESERALDLLLAPLAGQDGFRTITKKGLRIDNGHFYGPGLEIHVGKRVLVRHDPENMGLAYVFTEAGEFICTATNYERDGANRAEAAMMAKARQAEYYKTETAHIKRAARQITPEKMAEMYLSVAASDAHKVISLPRAVEVHSTIHLDEAARATDHVGPASITDNVRQYQSDVAHARKSMSDEDRWWEKYHNLQQRQDAGQILSEEDQTWMAYIETMPSFRARKEHEKMKSACVNENGPQGDCGP